MRYSERAVNDEVTHDSARHQWANVKHRRETWDYEHRDSNAERDDTRLRIRRDEGSYASIVRERYGLVKWEDPEDRAEGVDVGRVVFDWYRDGSFALESASEVDILRDELRTEA